MNKKTLITCTTKYSDITEIAVKNAEVLHQVDLQADVLLVTNVRDITPYQLALNADTCRKARAFQMAGGSLP